MGAAAGMVVLSIVTSSLGDRTNPYEHPVTATPAASSSAASDRLAKEQAALAAKRLERERAFAAAGPAKVTTEMRRLVAARKYEAALAYGDPYFDVGDKDFRAAYEQASKGVEAETKKKWARKEGVRIGMTQDEVLASSWGKPHHVNTTTTSYGVREQWVYDSGNYLYFRNGILTTIQN
ncbi:MAG: hypothetical protein IT516_12325 [Burkholderiales bacterium]|nr:hypothetical protein [Burkholderiales bacterium]